MHLMFIGWPILNRQSIHLKWQAKLRGVFKTDHPIRTQHQFENLPEPNQHKIKSIVKRLIDQCYETYFEEEMITCKLISYQVNHRSGGMSAKPWFCLPEVGNRADFQTNQEDVDLYSTFFTVQVTSYPFPESVNKTKKGDDIVSKVTAAVTAFMGPGTLLDHFKIIPPNTSSVVQEHVILKFSNPLLASFRGLSEGDGIFLNKNDDL